MYGSSYLFVPGNRPDRFEKARNAGANAVILDLEDAVPNGEKTEAREAVAASLSPDYPAYVRVNGVGTAWIWDDLEAITRPGLAGVVLPKAEDSDQVAEVAARIPAAATVLPLVETAAGIWNARELAEAPRVERLAFGSIDFQLDAGIDGEDEELLYARSRFVLASRVAGILPPLDGVTVALDDADRLKTAVERARRLGFGGKLCIHPKQLDAVNRGFMPSEDEISWARRVLEAADSAGTGAVRLGGEMIDRPVIERAKGILAHASAGRQD